MVRNDRPVLSQNGAIEIDHDTALVAEGAGNVFETGRD
jgi:hypothetical protein